MSAWSVGEVFLRTWDRWRFAYGVALKKWGCWWLISEWWRRCWFGWFGWFDLLIGWWWWWYGLWVVSCGYCVRLTFATTVLPETCVLSSMKISPLSLPLAWTKCCDLHLWGLLTGSSIFFEVFPSSAELIRSWSGDFVGELVAYIIRWAWYCLNVSSFTKRTKWIRNKNSSSSSLSSGVLIPPTFA